MPRTAKTHISLSLTPYLYTSYVYTTLTRFLPGLLFAAGSIRVATFVTSLVLDVQDIWAFLPTWMWKSDGDEVVEQVSAGAGPPLRRWKGQRLMCHLGWMEYFWCASWRIHGLASLSRYARAH